jgi:hypothetical protein
MTTENLTMIAREIRCLEMAKGIGKDNQPLMSHSRGWTSCDI